MQRKKIIVYLHCLYLEWKHQQKRMGRDTYIKKCLLWRFVLWLAKCIANKLESLRYKATGTAPTLELSFVLYSTDNQYSIMIDQQGCSQMFPVDL